MQSSGNWAPWRKWPNPWPAIVVGEIFVWIIVEVVLHLMTYSVGKMIIFIGSGGRAQFETWSFQADRSCASFTEQRVSQLTCMMVGLAFWVIVGVCLVQMLKAH